MEKLDEKAIESFSNVVGFDAESNNKTVSDIKICGSRNKIKAAKKEAENIRLVLRSRGEPFPNPSTDDEEQSCTCRSWASSSPTIRCFYSVCVYFSCHAM